jgi:hypothetical protein
MSLKQKVANFFPLNKAWNYARLRLLTVVLLWCAAGGALKGIHWLVESLSDGPRSPTKILSLGAFSDYRLIVVLGISVLALAGTLSIILMNTTPNKNDQAWVIDFLARLWDEVSSASTHAGAVLISAQIFFPSEAWGIGAPPGTRWIVICLYLMMGYFAYRDDFKSQPKTPAPPLQSAGQQPAPAQGAAPMAAPAPAQAPALGQAPAQGQTPAPAQAPASGQAPAPGPAPAPAQASQSATPKTP